MNVWLAYKSGGSAHEYQQGWEGYQCGAYANDDIGECHSQIFQNCLTLFFFSFLSLFLASMLSPPMLILMLPIVEGFM